MVCLNEHSIGLRSLDMNKQQINKLYDNFGPDGQNMTRADFHKEVRFLVDPDGITQDLRAIELQKARSRSARINIDRKVKNDSK